ncbi:hypothetical protein [Variovorax sp. SRS16]|uniref:hypothetical protein n=1 Tax=Variovorax sp. SRS16 TaxID=282217 RepID=UPI0013A5382D|nr:hypothetical protein [Variovorax sp. SRS16]
MDCAAGTAQSQSELVGELGDELARRGLERQIGAVSDQGVDVKVQFDIEHRAACNVISLQLCQALKTFLQGAGTQKSPRRATRRSDRHGPARWSGCGQRSLTTLRAMMTLEQRARLEHLLGRMRKVAQRRRTPIERSEAAIIVAFLTSFLEGRDTSRPVAQWISMAEQALDDWDATAEGA